MKPLANLLDHATRRAGSLLKDRKRTRRLLESVLRTLSRGHSAFDATGLTGKIQAAARMVRRSVNRQYPDVPWQSLVLITAGLIYFVTPVDSIPDFIPLLGFTDDIAILTAIFASISTDLDKFIEWEQSQQTESVTVIEAKIEDVKR
jgi:uncharacterized membrane protein YkvA (DUF1232 family)